MPANDKCRRNSTRCKPDDIEPEPRSREIEEIRICDSVKVECVFLEGDRREEYESCCKSESPDEFSIVWSGQNT